MEKNQDTSAPEFCVMNCGFYGSPLNNDMCSKCYKESQQKLHLEQQTAGAADIGATAPAFCVHHAAPAFVFGKCRRVSGGCRATLLARAAGLAASQPVSQLANPGMAWPPDSSQMAAATAAASAAIQQQQQQQQTPAAPVASLADAAASAAAQASVPASGPTEASVAAVPGAETSAGAARATQDAETAMAVDSLSWSETAMHNAHIESVISENVMDVSPDMLSSDSAPVSLVQSPVLVGASGQSTPKRRTQANKGRCFQCRARVPLVKQTTNKCRCEYVFCDSHRFADQHACEYDFLARDRKVLEKMNPKLNDLPRGGRSFNRID
ncbi:hypothetical protein GGI07_005297 [Coemansia sp. Benny D115]|nr:hypothetical protein GGI07_005297 [Coemansia sp. Benny D115]